MIHPSPVETRSPWTSGVPSWATCVRQVALISSSLLLLCPLSARAEEPLWGDTASTLGKGFVNATTRAGFRSSRPFRHHGGAVELTTEETNGDVILEYGLQPDL